MPRFPGKGSTSPLGELSTPLWGGGGGAARQPHLSQRKSTHHERGHMGGSWARDGKEMAGQALTSLLQEEALGISGSQPLTTRPPPAQDLCSDPGVKGA